MRIILAFLILIITCNVTAKGNEYHSENSSLRLLKKIYQSFFGDNHYEIHRKLKYRQAKSKLETKENLYTNV